MERAISAERRLGVILERAAEALAHDRFGAVADEIERSKTGSRRLLAHLSADREGASLMQTVALALKLRTRNNNEVVLDISWQSARHARLFPKFSGTLHLARDGGHCILSINGRYRPPLGIPGAFGDGVIGHRIARKSLDAYVGEISQRITNGAQHSSAIMTPTPRAALGAG